MISQFSKSILSFLAINILVIAISYHSLVGQNLFIFDIHEKSSADSILSFERIGDEKNENVEIDKSFPVIIGILSALVLASISYTVADEPVSGESNYLGKSGAAAVGAIVGFIGGFFISGAIMELRAKRAAKKEAQEYNSGHMSSTSVKEHVRLEPYLRNYAYGNQCGINLKFQF